MGDLAFSCAHWALGTTVLVGLAASEFSGAGTVIALPIALLAVTASGLCGSTAFEHRHRKKKLADTIDFFEIWLEILGYLTAAATCARIASATVDYMSRGRFRNWLFGLESHSLGEPWPDILGVAIIIVITVLFMLGLEIATPFAALLLAAIASSVLFFLTVGGAHTDIKFWNWKEDFMLRSWKSVLTTSAMCAFGFLNSFHKFAERSKFKTFTFILVPLLFYSLTSITFTFMSHYREVAGIAIPLVRVFEVRDVDWARPVMAVCTICVVCVALTEIMPILYGLFVRLSKKEWDIFVTSLQFQSSLTGAPVLTMFAAGSLAAILAFACPLFYLVRVMNAATLLKCALRSSGALYNRYKPDFYRDSFAVYQTNVQYSKLRVATREEETPTTIQRIKSIFCVPNTTRKRTAPNSSKRRNKYNTTSRKGAECDKEYLLLDDYSANKSDADLNGDSSSDAEEISARCTDEEEEESGSSTDIDAAVQEYKDTVQVATVGGSFSARERKPATKLTAAIVAIFTSLIFIASVCLSVCVILKFYYSFWCIFSVIVIAGVIILLLPQNSSERAKRGVLNGGWFPACAIAAIVLNNLLVTTLMEDVWPGLVFWFLAGTVLFLRCECCTCDGLLSESDNVRVHPMVEEALTKYKDKYVDTILITR